MDGLRRTVISILDNVDATDVTIVETKIIELIGFCMLLLIIDRYHKKGTS